ncbi:hypothetical protein Egran_06367 [Elaphomyces granulatus]|uniref:SCP domain-containing protein n=1 Tax=Elaphomyces granulatus TaxID=519963 RepID=A0A232LNY9_9EURO|nr:hypothetical protein Egran_06367 [Elaphomyces granulatus]
MFDSYILLLCLAIASGGFNFVQVAGQIEVITITTTSVAIALATPTSSSSTSSFTSEVELKETVLGVTNLYRQYHNASALIWNDTLADYAQRWANQCQWKHSSGPYGENLAQGFPNVTTAIDAWVNESNQYDYDPPTGFSEETGHFTQLVWKATTEVGCAATNCVETHMSDGDSADSSQLQVWYLVCEYAPAGNVVGDNNAFFEENVQPEVGSVGSSMSMAGRFRLWHIGFTAFAIWLCSSSGIG